MDSVDDALEQNYDEKKAIQDLARLGITFQDLAGKKTLDVGAGPGHIGRTAREYGIHVTSLDKNPDLWIDEGVDVKDPDYVVGDAASLPFPDNHFDVLLSHSAAYSLTQDKEELRKMIQEAFRVLKPGGQFRMTPGMDATFFKEPIFTAEEDESFSNRDRIMRLFEKSYEVLKEYLPSLQMKVAPDQGSEYGETTFYFVAQKPTRREQLQQMRAELETVRDAEGKPIDEGIKETVLYFSVLGIPTMQSCEGHPDEKDGRPMPWVRVGAQAEPEERFVGQEKAFAESALKNNVPLDRLKKADPEDLYWDVIKQVSENEETDEFKEWTKKNNALKNRVSMLLEEFYKDRKVEEDIKLEIDVAVGGEFEIYSHEEQMKDIIFHELSAEQWAHLSEKLPLRQEEMRAFTDFLKMKFSGKRILRKVVPSTAIEDAIKISRIRQSLRLEKERSQGISEDETMRILESGSDDEVKRLALEHIFPKSR